MERKVGHTATSLVTYLKKGKAAVQPEYPLRLAACAMGCPPHRGKMSSEISEILAVKVLVHGFQQVHEGHPAC